jgi:hypothetical protein
MAINFPTSPSLNDTYTTGGITWTWDGSTWKASSSFSETDPVYTASAAANVTNTKITNWDTSYGWGDHGTVGYLTSYTETDPAFNASAASTITGTQVTNWDTAYGWGNHASAGYITTYSETGTLADVTGRGATTSSNLTLGGIVQFNNNSAFANNKVLNFGGSSNGRILYVSATNSFDVRVPGGGEDLKLGAGTAVRITNENGLTDRAVFTASGLTVTGKLLYSNNYATTGDLPNATTYHGMFAHVHAEGHGYFAHAGAWTQLVDTGSNLSELADVATTAPSTSDVLTWDGANWGPAASGSSGSSLQSRTTASASTSSIANGAAADITISAAKTYALQKIQTSAAAWVTLYTDTTSRTNDASRTEATDPVSGSGVIAEVITTGAATQKITPGTIGWNDDGTPSSNVYLKVVNKSGSTQAITVTLYYVQLEA